VFVFVSLHQLVLTACMNRFLLFSMHRQSTCHFPSKKDKGDVGIDWRVGGMQPPRGREAVADGPSMRRRRG
jgi:hypothetical protein